MVPSISAPEECNKSAELVQGTQSTRRGDQDLNGISRASCLSRTMDENFQAEFILLIWYDSMILMSDTLKHEGHHCFGSISRSVLCH